MSQETIRPYNERVATVVGGKGALGSRITTSLESLGFQSLKICEKGDPFIDHVNGSTDLFFAVEDKEILPMLQASRDYLTPRHSILDGASVKEPLITTYRELDDLKVSVCSTHLGAVPSQPWRGIKVWVCEVGPNSARAKRLAIDLFLSTNSSIQTIDIGEHKNVERDQWVTMAVAHIVAGALRKSDFPLERFYNFATLNSEIFALSVGRTLGQGVGKPSEIVSTPNKDEFLETLKQAFSEFEAILEVTTPEDRGELQALMQQNIDFHNKSQGFMDEVFGKAGVVGARNANLRMHKFSFRTTDDRPGKLRELLDPFRIEGANLTAIDSMPGAATEDEVTRGVNPDAIVDFDIGLDPKTIDDQKEQRIKERLIEMGCTVKTPIASE